MKSSQIRSRVFEDIVNKTPKGASDLPKAEKFIREHLGVPELNDDCKRTLFNFAYVHAKYLNQKAVMNNQNERKVTQIHSFFFIRNQP